MRQTRKGALSANPRSLFIYQLRSFESYSIHVLDSHNRIAFEIHRCWGLRPLCSQLLSVSDIIPLSGLPFASIKKMFSSWNQQYRRSIQTGSIRDTVYAFSAIVNGTNLFSPRVFKFYKDMCLFTNFAVHPYSLNIHLNYYTNNLQNTSWLPHLVLLSWAIFLFFRNALISLL